METLTLDTESLIFMKEMSRAQSQMEEGEQQNGVSNSKRQRDSLSMDMKCPVGLHKGVLLYPLFTCLY